MPEVVAVVVHWLLVNQVVIVETVELVKQVVLQHLL
tara:strand:- start:277 stop:384 length:108 start_codon:yes stop_codon:yes gene_type:complete